MVSVLFIILATSFGLNIINELIKSKTMNNAKMIILNKEFKERMEAGDMDNALKIKNELMKMMAKPTAINIAIGFGIFGILSFFLQDAKVAMPVWLPLIGGAQVGWIIIYIISNFIFNPIAKILVNGGELK